jgi:hypothetical protein
MHIIKYIGNIGNISNYNHICKHNSAKVIYENNPILCQFPTYLIIEYDVNKCVECDLGAKCAKCIRSFTIIDVKYIDNLNPFEMSLEDE